MREDKRKVRLVDIQKLWDLLAELNPKKIRNKSAIDTLTERIKELSVRWLQQQSEKEKK